MKIQTDKTITLQDIADFIAFQRSMGIRYRTFDEAAHALVATLASARAKLASARAKLAPDPTHGADEERSGG